MYNIFVILLSSKKKKNTTRSCKILFKFLKSLSFLSSGEELKKKIYIYIYIEGVKLIDILILINNPYRSLNILLEIFGELPGGGVGDAKVNHIVILIEIIF